MAALPNFRIETVDASSEIKIKLAGELDSATCDQLATRFEEAVGPPVASTAVSRELVLDLSDVSFIDSSGMRAIILVERSARERGLTLTIIPPPDALTDLLRITGVTEHAALAPQSGDRPAARPFIERIELELGREATAPGRARAELREAFSGRLSDNDQSTVTLLTSELVTNAVIHPAPDAGGSIGLRITACADRVRVEVSDPGAGFEAGNIRPRPRELGGQGLFVVDRLASRWGTTRRTVEDQDVFCVWFELDLEYDLSTGPGARERPVATAEG